MSGSFWLRNSKTVHYGRSFFLTRVHNQAKEEEVLLRAELSMMSLRYVVVLVFALFLVSCDAVKEDISTSRSSTLRKVSKISTTKKGYSINDTSLLRNLYVL